MSAERPLARLTTRSGSKVKGGWRPAWWKAGTPCPVCNRPTRRRQECCSLGCSKRLWFQRAPKEDQRARALKISKRMKVVRIEIPNPMERPEIRAKISATMKERGHTFSVRGGNGSGPTRCELILFRELVRLRPRWLWSLGHAESLGGRQPGYPTCYKIDVASMAKKIAVEVDGNSHRNPERRAADAKKSAKLASLGWFVLRYTNRQVEKNPVNVAATIINTFTRSQSSLALTTRTLFS